LWRYWFPSFQDRSKICRQWNSSRRAGFIDDDTIQRNSRPKILWNSVLISCQESLRCARGGAARLDHIRFPPALSYPLIDTAVLVLLVCEVASFNLFYRRVLVSNQGYGCSRLALCLGQAYIKRVSALERQSAPSLHRAGRRNTELPYYRHTSAIIRSTGAADRKIFPNVPR
ncbi:hypothetical protein KCU81_g719, partial [Aureobasidium melanogenum]